MQVGAHSYDVTYGDPPDYGIALPLSFGWSTPDDVDFFPTQRNPATGSFSIVVPTLADVADIALDDLVLIDMYVPASAPDPWQSVEGAVSQLDAQVGARNMLTVSFTDPTILLARKVVGLGAWPLEDAAARLARICTEAGVTLDRATNLASTGTLAATSANAPTDALTAIRATLRDDADRNNSYGGDPVYGRVVYSYSSITNKLYVRTAERRVVSWPAELGDDGTLHRLPGAANALDGCAVQTDGRWSRLPIDLPTWVLVDGVPFGDPTAPGAVPYVRSTSYTTSAGTATAITTLGRSLLPDDSETNVLSWRTDTVRHLSYLDPEPVTEWLGQDASPLATPGMGWALLRPVIVEPVDASVTLDGRTWIAGVLTGARLTIPPGGKFYTDVTLRPDLPTWITGTPHGGAATYADLPPALTYDQIDPLLQYRDLNLIGV